MCREEARLDTFQSWPPSAPVRPRELSQAGFYYTNSRDRVKCFCCGGVRGNWKPGDEAWKEHERHFSHCVFILGHEVGNIPCQQSPDMDTVPYMGPYEECLRSFAGQQHPSSVVQRVLEMGFDAAEVERTAWERVCKTGVEYDSVEALISDLTRAESESDETQDKEGRTFTKEDPMEKLRKLQQEKLCKVCMDKNIAIVFIPCGHLVTCKKCSEVLSKCPICCAPIIQKVKTYLS
ncbi:hypothetical protein AOXY_G16405 [Acipenser oxyrinchus oxyrinchus]|uniref:E3 ubiquitin-protein ligase XIAP n=1 Tax=Acipenser oxyrinchus oxyrinchus TaxID=40147 RepID=A0AAD8D5M6_ACIOX|nr:hypothetical protein AOXY_G16405 [Acipenser oxyrinchus oxyrinchus]